MKLKNNKLWCWKCGMIVPVSKHNVTFNGRETTETGFCRICGSFIVHRTIKNEA